MDVNEETCELCIDHLGCSHCNECNLEVDQYGNTEDSFEYCSFPDCGCDGARLCMAPNGPSDHANTGNIEGMWQSKKPEVRKAVFDLVVFAQKTKTNSPAS